MRERGRSARKFPGKSSQHPLGSPHIPTLPSACHRQLGPQPRLSEVHAVPPGLPKTITKQMDVWLPAKLMRQVLVQKEKSFIQVPCNLGEWWTPISKTNSSSCSSLQCSYREREGRASFSYPVFFLPLVCLGPYPFIFLAFGSIQCKNLSLLKSWPMEETP